MERKIEKYLLKWKSKPNRMPLILYGARQVGKTYSALTFGKRHYKNCVYVNMEDTHEAGAIFERDLNPDRIIRELSVKTCQTIFKGDTLIILDEIQACERALTALKYFCENAPEYHIIAAGSLLGVALNREKHSFPVGKVDMAIMYPLDFEEFLWALGRGDLAGMIRECFATFTAMAAHDTAMELYRTYLVVGGMPSAVSVYASMRDFDYVLATQKALNDSYIADMAKYASPQETAKILAAWRSIPAQLAKENHKFQYKLIKPGARAYDYETPLSWLETAGLIHKCVRVNEGKMPLSAYADPSAYKVYMMDTGLLCSKFDIAASVVLGSVHTFDGFKGALAENYIMQALISNGFKPYYWASQGKAELDFVFQNRWGEIIPLEAKFAYNMRSRSLRTYADIYSPICSIRISARNFGREDTLMSLPLYAAYCMEP